MIYSRNRRLRVSESVRSLVRETTLSTDDFVMPIFVMEGQGKQEPIPSMPGIFRRSIDLTIKECQELFKLGIKAVNLYMKVSDHLKDNTGKEAWNPDGLMQQTIKAIKDAVPEMLVMPDVALDPYSIYGHDGIIENGKIANDATNAALAKMAYCGGRCVCCLLYKNEMYLLSRCAIFLLFTTTTIIEFSLIL